MIPGESELAEIEARLNAASPGPWDAQPWTHPNWVVHAPGVPHLILQSVGGNDKANITFAAHARADVALLLAEVRRLRQYVAMLSVHLPEEP